MELSKNNRFRTGTSVDIYHTPVYQTNTVAIDSTGLSAQYYRLRAYFKEDLTTEQFGVGDLCALSFGVGKITAVTVSVEEGIGSYLWLEFEQSVFRTDNIIEIMKYVGSEIQNAIFFLTTGRVEANFTVANYKEEVNQATYGYAKTVYNLQTKAELVLTPIRMVDDGTLNKIMYSKGFVLKSCNDDNYAPTVTWNTEFPLELSGTSIDPVFRRAYLKTRKLESKSRRSKAKLTFQLIG